VCLVVVVTLPIVEAVHTHKATTRDCSICIAAHLVKAPIASHPILLSYDSVEALPMLNLRHRSALLTENNYVRPPPFLA
jgi:hypothetical protein